MYKFDDIMEWATKSFKIDLRLPRSCMIANRNNDKINSIFLKSTFKFSVSHPQCFGQIFGQMFPNLFYVQMVQIFFFGLFFLFFGPTLLGPMNPCLSISQSVCQWQKLLPTIGFLWFYIQSCSLLSGEKWRSLIFEEKNVLVRSQVKRAQVGP